MKIFKIYFLLAWVALALPAMSQDKEKETSGKDDKKAKNETKISEVVFTDSVPASELVKRAVNWVKLETPKYEKTSGVTTSGKAECIAVFKVKPKELNPQCDYTGTISMKVVIECRESKYKYIVSQMKHKSTSGKTSMGSIDNTIPECGSMVMPAIQMKKLRGEALRFAEIVIEDLREGMLKDSNQVVDEW